MEKTKINVKCGRFYDAQTQKELIINSKKDFNFEVEPGDLIEAEPEKSSNEGNVSNIALVAAFLCLALFAWFVFSGTQPLGGTSFLDRQFDIEAKEMYTTYADNLLYAFVALIFTILGVVFSYYYFDYLKTTEIERYKYKKCKNKNITASMSEGLVNVSIKGKMQRES